MLINSHMSTLNIKKDDQFEEYLTVNKQGKIQKETFQFLPEDWELSYSLSIDEDDETKATCWTKFGIIPEENIILLRKSENSKDSSKLEIGDEIFYLNKIIGLNKIIKEYESKTCSIELLHSSKFGLKDSLKPLETEFKMNENEILKLANSFDIRWVKYDLPVFTFDIRSDVEKQLMTKEMGITKVIDNFEYFKEDLKERLIPMRKRVDYQSIDDLNKMVQTMDEYCEGPGRINKDNTGFFGKILNFFKNLIWSSNSNKDDDENNNKAVLCDYQRYKNLEDDINRLLLNNSHKHFYDAINKFLNTYPSLFIQNYQKSLSLEPEMLWTFLFEEKFPENDSKLDFKTVIREPFIKVGSAGKRFIPKSEQNETLLKEIERMEEIFTSITKITLGDFNDPKNDEEKIFVESIKTNILNIKDRFKVFTETLRTYIKDIKLNMIDVYIPDMIEDIFESEINSKFGFMTKDGLLDHRLFLKILTISGIIPAPDYLGESTNIKLLEQTDLILV